MSYDGWIVVGLGNPGPSYAGDPPQRRLPRRRRARRPDGRQLEVPQVRASARDRGHGSAACPGIASCSGGPARYMNESGGPVSALLKFYKAEPERLIVVQDEIDLPYGELRVKFGGGDNGHNGLKSIRKSIGTGDYYRVRLGVGRPRGQRRDGRLRARQLRQRREARARPARQPSRRRGRVADHRWPRTYPERVQPLSCRMRRHRRLGVRRFVTTRRIGRLTRCLNPWTCPPRPTTSSPTTTCSRPGPRPWPASGSRRCAPKASRAASSRTPATSSATRS